MTDPVNVRASDYRPGVGFGGDVDLLCELPKDIPSTGAFGNLLRAGETDAYTSFDLEAMTEGEFASHIQSIVSNPAAWEKSRERAAREQRKYLRGPNAGS